MGQNLFEIIDARTPSLSKGQRAIAAFITAHYDKAAFMTASRLGRAVGVSESTIVRFATELGYAGYPQMQKALQEMVRGMLTSVQRINIGDDIWGHDDYLKSTLMSDIENLRTTFENIDREAFAASVEAILQARDIYIVGVRSSSALASFLYFYLNLLFSNVRLINSSTGADMYEQIFRAGPEDVVIGISFPRYSRRTVQTMQYAHDQGARVIVLTDSIKSPLTRTAHYTLLARCDMVSFVDSLVSPMAVLNALVVTLGMRKREEISQTFARLEHIWDTYDIYEKSE